MGRKFLPGGALAMLMPDFIVWTEMLFNHSTKTQGKFKEVKLFETIPKDNGHRSNQLHRIETLRLTRIARHQNL